MEGSAVFHITSLEEEEAAAARRLWRWTEGVKPAPAAEALRGPEASEHRAVRRRGPLHIYMDRVPSISVKLMEHKQLTYSTA